MNLRSSRIWGIEKILQQRIKHKLNCRSKSSQCAGLHHDISCSSKEQVHKKEFLKRGFCGIFSGGMHST